MSYTGHLYGCFYQSKNPHLKIQRPKQSRNQKFFMKKTGIIGVSVLAIIGILLLIFAGCERIDAGHVGIRVNMTGDEKGVAKTEYVTGWVTYNKVASQIYEFPTFQQHPEYEPFTVPAKGGTIFTIHPQFNYAVNPGEVAAMFQNLRQPLPNI